MNQMEKLGWNGFFEKQLSLEDKIKSTFGRIVEEQKNLYRVATEQGHFWGEISFQMWDQATSRLELPVVGDWVGLRPATGDGRVFIQRLLKRQTQFVRQPAGGKTEPQMVAANMETVFIVTSLKNHSHE